MRPSRHFLRGEFIGLSVTAESKGLDRPKIGVVVDETRNTLLLETGTGQVTVPKKGSTLLFRLDDGRAFEVPGGVIAGRPEDRVKKRFGRMER